MSDQSIIEVPAIQTVWYANSTFYSNAIAVIVLVAAQFFGITIDPKLQAAVMACLNIVLQVRTMAPTREKALQHNIDRALKIRSL